MWSNRSGAIKSGDINADGYPAPRDLVTKRRLVTRGYLFCHAGLDPASIVGGIHRFLLPQE